MSGDLTPTVRHRRLSSELKRLRESAQLSVQAVADQMGWDQTKVYRIERGQWKRLNPQDIRALAECYGVEDDALKQALIDMARQSRVRGWWVRYSDVLGEGVFVSLEAEATALFTIDVLAIPGLLQTSEYVDATLRTFGMTDESTIQRHVEARMVRQQRLEDTPPLALHAVFDEAALWKHIGDAGIMKRQIQHLISVSARANVDLRVIPNDAGVHPGAFGPFALIELPSFGEPTVVFLEFLHDKLLLEEANDISRYRLIYDQMRRSALGKDETRDLMTRIHDQIRD